jgi:hypothetical protein
MNALLKLSSSNGKAAALMFSRFVLSTYYVALVTPHGRCVMHTERFLSLRDLTGRSLIKLNFSL